MKTFTLTALLVLLSAFAITAQKTINDTLSVSTETIINANIKRLTTELNLSTEQQEKARLFLLSNNMVVMPDANTSDFMKLLTTEQHLLYKTILESDNNSLRSYAGNSAMRAVSAQGTNTITLNDAEHIKDVLLAINNHPDKYANAISNNNWFPRVSLMAWTYSGYFMAYKSLMKFVLDDIPIGSDIINATLYLYSDPTKTSSHSIESNCTTSGSNAFYIEQITQPWSDQTVTWNTTPTSTTTGRVLVPTSTSITENRQIDLTDMVQTWVDAPSNNYGVKFYLQTESKYRARNYASMEHSNTSIRPKLVVNYNLPLMGIEFTYDASGNRIRREVIVIPAQTRSLVKSIDNSYEPIEPIESSWNDFVIKIFPNPTHGNISIRFDGEVGFEQAQYRLYNTSGNMVGNGYINAVGSNPIEMSQLPAGIYILTLQYNKETKTYKIIKQ